MKKVNIIDLDNVYKDIIKNVKNKRRIYEFEKYKLEYLTLCADIINEGNYKDGYYNIFIIYEPKLRVIMSQKLLDKIINHYITRTVLIPKLDKFLLDENTATRINKGHSYAINLFKSGIEYYKRRYKTFYFLKLKIKKYFYNIDHEVLKSLIKPYILIKKLLINYKCELLEHIKYNKIKLKIITKIQIEKYLKQC